MEIILEVLFHLILPLAVCGFISISLAFAILLLQDRLAQRGSNTQCEARTLRQSQPSRRPLFH